MEKAEGQRELITKKNMRYVVNKKSGQIVLSGNKAMVDDRELEYWGRGYVFMDGEETYEIEWKITWRNYGEMTAYEIPGTKKIYINGYQVEKVEEMYIAKKLTKNCQETALKNT